MHSVVGLPYSSHKCASVSDQSSCRLSDMGSMPQLLPGANGQRPPILVLKVGTSTLMKEGKNSFSLANLGKFVDSVCDLKDRGYHVVMISSGAVGSGCVHMHVTDRPKLMVEKQAISAIGQCRLVRLWEDIFAIREQKVAQLLVTRTDLIDRPRFLNFRNTLLQVLNLGCIPIINENDAIAAEGLKFGDNDTLGAYVSISIGASWYFMLTDVDCLYTANPRHHPDAKPIAYVGKIDKVYQLLDADENDGTQWGSGGMRTKIIAAKLCCATGIHTALCHGAHPDRVVDIMSFAEAGSKPISMDVEQKGTPSYGNTSYPTQPLTTRFLKGLQKASRPSDAVKEESTSESSASILDGSVSSPPTIRNEDDETTTSKKAARHPNVSFVTFTDLTSMPYLGTIFAGQPCTQVLRDQRRWILSLPVRGRVYVDEATCRAVFEKRRPLFAYGVVRVVGEFYPGEAIAIHPASMNKAGSHQGSNDEDCECELARCLVNFSSQELTKVAGKKSSDFQRVLGYYCAHEVAHKSDIIFVDPSPVCEKFKVKLTMVETSDDEDGQTELQKPIFAPVPMPAAGETH